MTERAFRIRGMDCADEVAVLKRAVGPIVGGEDRLSFDLLQGKMGVEGLSEVPLASIQDAVAKTGMRAETWDDRPLDQDGENAWQRHGRTSTTAASGGLVASGLVVHAVIVGGVTAALTGTEPGFGDGVPPLARSLYALAILSGVWFVVPRAWYAARTLRPDMNLLMTIAVAGAVGIGEWFEAATVAFLFSLSLALESWSVDRARRAVAALLELSPSTVRLVTADGNRDVSARDAAIGSVFLVKPGERVPLDGDVRAGQSQIDEAPITGESLPVPKETGSSVFAGSINGDGALEVVSTKPADDTVLANIIRLVRQAQSRRAPSEQWVSRFARVYTPAVFVFAIAVFLLPPLLLGGAWEGWAYRALVLLVIGCPCALVISTPVSIVASLTAAARQGVLIKGGVFVETPARLATVAFDKTGTLTEGSPAVIKVVTEDGQSEERLLAIAASLEAHSTHPLARAIVAHAHAQGVSPGAVQDFQVLPGRGATGWVDGRQYWVGSHRYLEERGQASKDVHATLEALSIGGRTVGDDERAG